MTPDLPPMEPCLSSKEAAAMRSKLYNIKNREKIAAKRAEYRKKNKDKIDLSIRRWQERNRERVKMYRRNVQARRRGAVAGEIIAAEDWIARQKEFGNRCAYCMEEKTLTMDHVIPLSRGGFHHIDNIFPACMPCNRAKGSKTLEEFNASL